jgi:threonine synthase
MVCVSNILKKKRHWHNTTTAFKKIAMKVTGIYFENSTQQTVPAKNSMC